MVWKGDNKDKIENKIKIGITNLDRNKEKKLMYNLARRDKNCKYKIKNKIKNK